MGFTPKMRRSTVFPSCSLLLTQSCSWMVLLRSWNLAVKAGTTLQPKNECPPALLFWCQRSIGADNMLSSVRRGRRGFYEVRLHRHLVVSGQARYLLLEYRCKPQA